MTPRSRLTIILIAYAAFTALGMPGGLLGVAWPSIRDTFGLSLDAVGTLLLAVTVGSLVAAFTSGPVAARIGIGWLLVLSTLAAMVGLLGYALAPVWWVMILCGVFVGASAGALDSALNVVFAAYGSSRLMSWLHAFFGAGAMVGPLIMTAMFSLGRSWRWGYGVAALFQAVLLACFALTLRRWDSAISPEAREDTLQPLPSVAAAHTLALPALWLSLVLFFFAAGLEASSGQWPYSLFTEARGVASTTAGLWVSVYWAALTIGRVVFGLVGDRLTIVPALRASVAGVAFGAALVWWRGDDLASFLGLAIMGLAFAPLFPLLQLATPGRLGSEHAANAIGFQTAAAYLGVGLLPALAGLLAERITLEIVGPFLLGGAVTMALIHESVVRRSTPRRAEFRRQWEVDP
jgi:fucose permease